MFRFRRDGTKILIDAYVYIPELGVRYYTTHIQCNSETEAAFLRTAYQSDMWDKLRAIRETAYIAGWKDAKSKKVARKSWWTGMWE